MYAETLHAHIRRRRRSGAPSLGRKMEARDSVPPIRRQHDALFRSGTGDTHYHSENAGAATRSLAADGIVVRTAYAQVPPKVEYRLTSWGQSLCPTLDAILKWADRRPVERR